MTKWRKSVLLVASALAVFLFAACASSQAPALSPPETLTPTATPTVQEGTTPAPNATPTNTRVATARTPTATATQSVTLPTASSRPVLDPQRLAVMDKNALNVPDSAEQYAIDLASYLTAPAQNDLEKTLAIYRWITENIAYDFPSYLSGKYPDQSADAALKRRTGVCAGYANLFQTLGKYAGLGVVVVEGWSKGYGYVNNQLDDRPNHAWNAVLIDGKWYLVDSTWGSGFISQEKQFVRQFNDYYFLAPPQQLILDHYPKQTSWQLLDAPITKQAFLAAPRVWPEFFENGIGLVSHREAFIKADKQVEVTLSTPQDTLLTASLRKGDLKLPDLFTFVQRKGDGYSIRAAFQQPGQYTLTIFSRKVFESGAFHGTLEYTVDVAQGDPASPGFPMVWDSFFEDQIGLVSHPGGIIRTAGDLTVTLSAPQDVLMLAQVSRQEQDLPDTATFVQRVNGSYEVRAAFPGDGEFELTVYTKRAGQEGQYHSSLRYLVEVTGAATSSKGFPSTYHAFTTNNVVLYAPFSGVLPLGSTQTFRLAVPGVEKVAVVMGDDWRYLDLKDGVFQGDVKISGADVGVYARFPGSTQFSGLLTYTTV
ncbi:MAG: hypothetical protein HY680_00835 [Chloroflexi bacterium]|nr:hypothetical protein [Chloroflexota bacterium]